MTGTLKFQPGDLVTRDGSDVQRVIRMIADDTIEIECVKASAHGWCRIGEREINMARRYEFAGDVVDGRSDPAQNPAQIERFGSSSS